MFNRRERARQLIDYEDMTEDRRAPMDIDGVYDCWNRGWIFYEYKHRDAEMPEGQRYTLEKLCKQLESAGREAVALLCEHDVDDPHEDVEAGEALVRAYYYRGRWRRPRHRITVKDFSDEFKELVRRKGDE